MRTHGLIASGILLGSATLAQAGLVGLNAAGTQLAIGDGNAAAGDFTTLDNPYSGGETPALWANVATYDGDSSVPGDEIYVSRQLDEAAGRGGISVYGNQPDGNGDAQRQAYSLVSWHFDAMAFGNVLNGGNDEGLVGVRQGTSNTKPLFELWDAPVTGQTVNTSIREEFHRGNTGGTTWDTASVGVGEFSVSGAGEEVVTLRGSRDLIEIYGRTGGSGDTSYTRVDYFESFSTVEALSTRRGIGPNGNDVVVMLREDGRISFYDPTASGQNTDKRLGFTTPDTRYENFVKIADVTDANPGLELITGFNDTGEGTRGIIVRDMPDLSGLTPGAGNELTPSLVNVIDFGSEIRNVSEITVPEPASLAMLGLGGLAMLSGRRRA
jgi:hypothetical protein